MNERDPDRTIIQHDNGFTMFNTRNVEWGSEPYVLPSQCEHVFYFEVLGRAGWSYVVIYDLRGRSVRYTIAVEDDIEEEYDVEENLVHVSNKDIEEVEGDMHDNVLDEDDVDDMSDKELEVKPNVGEHVLDDDDMIGIDDIDDDLDMDNPFNMNSNPDDIDDELDEEKD